MSSPNDVPEGLEGLVDTDQTWPGKEFGLPPRTTPPKTVGAPRKFTREQVAQALHQAGGIQSGAAMLLQCDRITLRKYIDDFYPELRETIPFIKDGLLDLAESQLVKNIRDGNLTAIIFFLKCQGKSRGYVEKQEMTGRIQMGPLQVTTDDLKNMSDQELKALLPQAGANGVPNTDPSRGGG